MTPNREDRRSGPARRLKDLAAPLAVAASLGALLGTVAAAGGHVGLSVDDVPQKLARVERTAFVRDSFAAADRAAVKVRVTRLEEHVAAIDSAQQESRYLQQVQALTSCLVARKVIRESAPDICAAIIRRGAP